MQIKINSKSFTYLFLFFMSAPVWSAGPSVEIGKELYNQPGTNSCVYCHGISGDNGKIAVAAKLTTPKQWKSYKGIGGEAAFKANKTQFMAHFKEAVVGTILNGAILHNIKFKPTWYDAKKAGGTLNVQMLGLKGSPSQAWLTKQKESGMTADIAAESAWLYIQGFDKDGVFK